MPDSGGRPTVAITIYLPRGVYERLGIRKARGHGPLTRQITRYCEEGLLRDELADAAADVQPDPGALGKIQARTRNQERKP